MNNYQTKSSPLISNQMIGCGIIHGSVHGITCAKSDLEVLLCHLVYQYGDWTKGRGSDYSMNHLCTINVIYDNRHGTVMYSSLTWHIKDPGWNYAQERVRHYTSMIIANNTVKQLSDVPRFSLKRTQIFFGGRKLLNKTLTTHK